MPIEKKGNTLVISKVEEITFEMLIDYDEDREITEIFTDATKIAASAFQNFIGLKEIILLKVKKIEDDLFLGCREIEKIDAPELEEIGKGAFFDCINLKKFNSPKLKKIGDMTFFKCKNLEKIYVPELEEVGEESFGNCNDLKLLILSKNFNITDEFKESLPKFCITTYPEYLQDLLAEKTQINHNDINSDPRIVNATIPPQVTNINKNAFANCENLEKIIILENVESLGKNIFIGCNNLKEITLPDKFISKIAQLGIPEGCKIIPLSEMYIKNGEAEKAIILLINAGDSTEDKKSKIDFYDKAIKLYNKNKPEDPIISKQVYIAETYLYSLSSDYIFENSCNNAKNIQTALNYARKADEMSIENGILNDKLAIKNKSILPPSISKPEEPENNCTHLEKLDLIIKINNLEEPVLKLDESIRKMAELGNE